MPIKYKLIHTPALAHEEGAIRRHDDEEIQQSPSSPER